MAIIDSLVSYWKLDEASGNAADAHASNTLTNNGTIPYVAAKINNGADLESTDAADYFSAADSAGLSITGNMSWSFWIKPESDTAAVLMQKWGAAGQRAYYVQLPSTTVIRLGVSAAGTTLNYGDVTVPTMTMDGSVWYHIVIAYTASTGTMEVYTQGVSRGTDATLDTSIFDGTSALEIGVYQEGGGRGNWYDGVLDEVGVWNKVLSATEVTDLYNGGAGFAYPFSAGGPANLKSLNTNLKANIKSYNSNLIANIKSINTNV